MQLSALLVAGLCAVPSVLGHGEPNTAEAIAHRDAHIKRSVQSLGSCANKLVGRGVSVERQTRTSAFVNRYLARRGLEGDFAAAPSLAKKQATCVLAPEQEEGPYYLDGELIREDITEDEAGIDLLLDVTVIDVNTCEPLSGVMLDFWSCNSTGTYSGYAQEHTTGLTWLRGLQVSDDDGVVQVTTKFPGWYGGRAQHIHIKAHVDYTIDDETETITGGTVPHTGQIFFDQDLLTTINAVAPYTLDTNPFTLNADDRVVTQQANSTEGYDAFVDITLTGTDVTDGLLGSLTIAIDPSATPGPA